MISILKKLIQTSRLDEYRSLIEFGLERGYKFVSLKNWYENDFYQNEKVFLLRHDVDYDNEGAFKMYEIEKELGVTSTFYYRWKTMDLPTMTEIHKKGFEVSLHFETLATYCRAHNIKSKEQVTEEVLQDCLKMFVEEKNAFEEKFWTIKTVCSHGDHRNRLIGIPNHVILNNVSREELGIYFETYDVHILKKIETYISDSSIKNNHNWRYGKSPIEAVENNSRSICLLTHPQHWNYHLRRNLSKISTDIKEHFFN